MDETLKVMLQGDLEKIIRDRLPWLSYDACIQPLAVDLAKYIEKREEG